MNDIDVIGKDTMVKDILSGLLVHSQRPIVVGAEERYWLTQWQIQDLLQEWYESLGGGGGGGLRAKRVPKKRHFPFLT